jgi:glycosyltransferase involved in cell wall biosynthesis
MTEEPIPIALCTRYDQLGASSRLRFYDFVPALREAGYAPAVYPFFRRRYLERLYAGGGKSRLSAAASLLRRLWLAFLLPERLIVEYELLPMMSAALELRLLHRHRYILNFDDNVWEKYIGMPRLAGKYDQLIAAASGVIVANDFLAEKVDKLNANWIKIPTVIDLDRYARRADKRPKLTLCWIGTPVTYGYLEHFASVLRAMARIVDFDLLVIASKNLASRAIPGVSMIFEDWSAETEVELISSCHIGIMPLDNDEFARGKSAYKLIQYLGAGLPVIGSAVGENRQVIDAGCGFLADSAEEWVSALRQLADPACRTKKILGAEARAIFFSLQRYGGIYTDFVRKTFRDK